MKRTLRHVRRGFTLVELIAAASITVVIGSLAAGLMMEASRVRTGAAVRVELSENAARAMEQSFRYIREIAQDAGLTGQAQITAATSSTLSFGVYALRLSSSNLELSTNSGTTYYALCRDVSSLTLRYYTADGTELTSPPLTATQRAAVRQVSLELRLARGNEAVQMRSRVYLRNFSNEAS